MGMTPEHRRIINQAHQLDIAPSELASELLERDLIETSVGILRKQKALFASLSEGAQDAVIREIEDVVHKAVASAISIIAGRGTVAVPVTLKSITVDAGLKVVANVDSETPHRHALVDAANHLCLLVLAPHDYDAATDSIKAEKDQQDLPLEGELQGIAATATIVDEFLDLVQVTGTPYEIAYLHVINGGEISAKAIQNATGVKRKESGELLLQLAENGVISAPDDDGRRALLIQTTKPAPSSTEVWAELTAEPAAPIDDSAYTDAVLKVQAEQRVSVSYLKAEFAVDEDTAEAWIAQMERDGVVSEENDMGGRSVFN